MQARSTDLGRRAAVLAVGTVIFLLVVLPVFRLGYVVWTEGSTQLDEVLGRPGLGEAVLNTVLLAVAVTVTAVPLGTLVALGLRRADVPGRGWWRFAMLLPVLVPQFVLGYSWTQAYGRAGFTDTILGLVWPSVLGPWGVWAVLVVNTVPLTYLFVAVGLATRAEPNLERAARASGGDPASVLRHVTLPLLRPSIAAASVLSFVLTMESFAIPQVMGTPAGFTTVTTTIYRDLSLGSDPLSFVEALTLALLLVALTVLVVIPADLWLGPRLRVTRVANPEGAPIVTPRGAAGRWIAAGLGGYLLLGVVLPLIALVTAAITPAVGVSPSPGNWTLDNFRFVVNARNAEALGRSALLAFAAAGLLTVLGGAVAVLERRRAGRVMASLVTVTLVLPGSTLAVALLITYGRWIGGTLTLILLAYLAKLWAFAHRPISGALDRLAAGEMQAARASGAKALTAVRTVALRPLAPALLGAWLICFVTALHEVTMSSLLYGPDSDTLAVVVLNSKELGRIGATAALSVLLTLVMLLPALPLWVLIRRLQSPRHPRAGGARSLAHAR
ncbi:MAG: iron ABC transporter permease [Propionibacteriales bacterium]|jgi:iron(III) transport system permease protein|nr:iron ABC transporter permease [Propionibacteriales bacterium]